MNYTQWANDTIQRGAPIEFSPEIKSWDDFALANAFLFHNDSRKRAMLNLQTLEMWPHLQSVLFNQSTLNDDLEYHERQLSGIMREIERREIP